MTDPLGGGPLNDRLQGLRAMPRSAQEATGGLLRLWVARRTERRCPSWLERSELWLPHPVISSHPALVGGRPLFDCSTDPAHDRKSRWPSC